MSSDIGLDEYEVYDVVIDSITNLATPYISSDVELGYLKLYLRSRRIKTVS
jgi:hypothetical protein